MDFFNGFLLDRGVVKILPVVESREVVEADKLSSQWRGRSRWKVLHIVPPADSRSNTL